MSINERIRFFRTIRGMTQKQLGRLLGFPQKSADVRIAQYEKDEGAKPRKDLTLALAKTLEVSPLALDVPNIDNSIALMHTLFTLEDLYGLTIGRENGLLCLKVDKTHGPESREIIKMLNTWNKQADRLKSCEITKEEYDNWRYRYPNYKVNITIPNEDSQKISQTTIESNK